jgi:hypothetical protein
MGPPCHDGRGDRDGPRGPSGGHGFLPTTFPWAVTAREPAVPGRGAGRRSERDRRRSAGCSSTAADTSTASASAIAITALGIPIGSGTQTASNNGAQATVTSTLAPLVSGLGGQTLLTAGALSQTAVARADGSSVACAGITGPGGLVSVATDGTCAATNGSSGISVNLAGLAEIRADAIVAQCTATSDGVVTASARLANAGVYVLGLKILDLSSNPAVNSGVVVPGVATLGTNMQTSPNGAGSIRANSLEINLLSGTVSAILATATCGVNVKTFATSVLPAAGLPLAGAVLVAGGLAGRSWFQRRSRRTVQVVGG